VAPRPSGEDGTARRSVSRWVVTVVTGAVEEQLPKNPTLKKRAWGTRKVKSRLQRLSTPKAKADPSPTFPTEFVGTGFGMTTVGGKRGRPARRAQADRDRNMGKGNIERKLSMLLAILGRGLCRGLRLRQLLARNVFIGNRDTPAVIFLDIDMLSGQIVAFACDN
jgi:hypothetical protein